jgi:LacI family transcriptional regulator
MNRTRTTIKDVAKAAGVSVPVVSVVTNNRIDTTIGVSAETRQRVLQAARELNYKPSLIARGLVEKKTYAVGLLLSTSNACLAPDVIRGVQDVAIKRRYSTMVYLHGNSREEAKMFAQSMDRQVDALIIDRHDAPSDPRNVDSYRELAQTGFPLVELFGSSIAGVPRLNIDYSGDGRRATEHFINLGHQRIAIVIHEGYQQPEDNRATWDFYTGYRQALTQFGLRPIVIPVPAIVSSRHSLSVFESGYQAAWRLSLLTHRPTAVICHCNRRVQGLVQGLNEAGLSIPDDISMLSYGAPELVDPVDGSLTRLVVAARRIGQAAADAIFAILKGRAAEGASIASDWIAGSSTAPHPSPTLRIASNQEGFSKTPDRRMAATMA